MWVLRLKRMRQWCCFVVLYIKINRRKQLRLIGGGLVSRDALAGEFGGFEIYKSERQNARLQMDPWLMQTRYRDEAQNFWEGVERMGEFLRTGGATGIRTRPADNSRFYWRCSIARLHTRFGHCFASRPIAIRHSRMLIRSYVAFFEC